MVVALLGLENDASQIEWYASVFLMSADRQKQSAVLLRKCIQAILVLLKIFLDERQRKARNEKPKKDLR